MWESIEATSVFAGAQVRRKTFVMRVVRRGLASSQIMEAALDEVVEQLAGFKAVTLELYRQRYLLEGPEEITDAWQDANPRTGLIALVQALRWALEPALGPSFKYGLKVKGLNGGRYNVGVTFHPRDYLCRKISETKKHSDDQTSKMTHHT